MSKTLFFPAITNRDYLKDSGGIRQPLWKFFNGPLDGFLMSMAYKTDRQALPPDLQGMFDCGAWTYRESEIPPVTPESIYQEYKELAKPNDILVAPDHMMLPSCDVEYRRKFNIESAKEFISICRKSFIPMATIHGENIPARLEYAKHLLDMGYTHMAIGGVAGKHPTRPEKIKLITVIRSKLPNTFLHVFGLSSPDYRMIWERIGINSCDGTGFTAKAVFGGYGTINENGNPIKFTAVKKGDDFSHIPKCDCKACIFVRGLGQDTRSFGSNESNLGRAAHNFNINESYIQILRKKSGKNLF